MRFLDLSGFMFSGKAAVSDLLREFSGIYVPNYRDEFDLLRIPGGLIDLKSAVDDWSPVRTHAALTRFERTVRKLAAKPRFPFNAFRTGYAYGEAYPRVLPALDRFLKNAVILEWNTPWPYDDLEDGPFQTLLRKVRAKFNSFVHRRYRLTCAEVFYPAAQEFLRDVLTNMANHENYDWWVTHNALEPFNPERNFGLFGEDALSIVVDRDPRDIYATAITSQQGFNDRLSFYKRIAGAHDVDTFVNRHNLYRSQINRDSRRVLRIQFEELINKYDASLRGIADFLGLSLSNHKDKCQFFDPSRSRKNVGLWTNPELKDYSKDFARIAAECMGTCQR